MRLSLLPLLFLAACGSETQPEQAASVPPPPAELCDQARKGLEELRSKAAIDFDSKGEATIVQDAWLQMGAGQHSEFARMLAFHAACASPDGSAERLVRIRNETGTMLLENRVPTNVDLGAIE